MPERMTRRSFIEQAAGAAALYSLPVSLRGAENRSPPERPNLLLIQADDQYYSALGCLGDPAVKTPHIDRLAARGVAFRRAVCQAAACLPSRTSLLTGTYPHENGCMDNKAPGLDPDTWTFPAALQRAGYHTALVGKMHFRIRGKNDWDRVQKHLGFDDFRATYGKVIVYRGGAKGDPYSKYLAKKGLLKKVVNEYRANRKGYAARYVGPSVLEPDDYVDGYIGLQAVDWVRSYRRKKPFFLWVNFTAPHPPCDAPEPYASMYDPAAMPPHIPRPLYKSVPKMVKNKVVRMREIGFPPDHPQHVRAGHYALISHMDFRIGQIVEALEAQGRLDNTVIVFCADHGTLNGDHGLYGKGQFYRGSINAPLVMSVPSLPARGRVEERLVEIQDLAPTLLELAGSAEAERCRGHSLLPLLGGEGAYPRKEAFAEIRERKMIVTERYKYAHGRGWDIPMLFDLGKDPTESDNLQGRPELREVERELRDKLAAWAGDPQGGG